MDSELIKKALLGKCNKSELRQVRTFLNSQEGEKFISEHFDKNNLSIETLLSQHEENKFLESIHNRINIEELLHEISKESEQHLNTSERDRAPYRGSQSLKHKPVFRKRSAYLAIITFFILVTASYLFMVSNMNDLTIERNDVVWIEKSTDRGQQLTIRLVDGTQVILNANSTIRYPEFFSDSVRYVAIQGEAYFEVAHDETQPFVVDGGLIMSRVLGTSFNIVYDPDEMLSTIALVTGKVEVTQKNNQEKLILSPGEEASINEGNSMEKGLFDVEKTVAWKDKIIFFSGENYPEVFKYLENWYGVNIKISNDRDKLVSWRLNAKFENETLENILDALSESHGFQYKMEGKNVSIKF